MRMEIRRDVDAPADRLWTVATDLDASPTILSGVTAVERLDGERPFGVGTRWRETRDMFGREVTEELEVTGCEPGRSYTVESEGQGAVYRTIVSVEPRGEQSRIALSFTIEPRGLIARLMAATLGRLFVGVTRQALEQDLEDLARAAEGG